MPKTLYKTPQFLRPSPVSSDSPDIYRLESFPLTFGGYTYEGWIAYRVGHKPAPLVLVLPNYAGLKQFDKDQAMFMAKLGYIGLAVRLYKEVPGYQKEDRNPIPNSKYTDEEGRTGPVMQAHFQGAFTALQTLLNDPRYWRGLMAEYLNQARTHPAVHHEHAAAIGCVGHFQISY